MTSPDTTILIAARDAAATIARAVRSGVAQGGYPIVLVDDYSSDGTADIAIREAPDLSVVRPPSHGPLGLTRQCGLDAVDTPFAMWLDADDELLPGRAARLAEVMAAEGADLAFDEIELVDGVTDRFLRRCPIPAFLDSPPFLFRQFERNYLPGVGQVAFRTAAARRIGYDAELHGTEDSDFVLRGLMAGLQATLVREPGYRMYAYPTSVSRQLDTQRRMYRKALLKHAYADVRVRAAATGATPARVAWILASMAIFREEFEPARCFVEEAAIVDSSETDESCPLPNPWRYAFTLGTLDALSYRTERARSCLEAAEAIHPTPEGANNLGVVLARLGDPTAARALFERAVRSAPDYVDARRNLTRSSPDRITTHPLRRFATRTDYAPVPRISRELVTQP